MSVKPSSKLLFAACAAGVGFATTSGIKEKVFAVALVFLSLGFILAAGSGE